MMAVSNILLVLLSMICPFLIPYLYKIFRQRNSQIGMKTMVADEEQKLPPGNTGWPFLGETLDFFSRIQQGVLEKFFAERSNKYSSKVFKTSLMGHPVAVLCGAEGNKFLFSRENKLLKHWWPSVVDQLFPRSHQKSNADDIPALRRFNSSLLKGNALREYVGIFDATMKQQLETYRNCQEVIKVSEMSSKYTFTSACRIILGLDDPEKIDEFEKGMKIITTGLHSMPINFPGTALNRGIKVSKKIRKELQKMIRRRKADLARDDGKTPTSGKDFLSHMLQLTDENDQIINEADMASHLAGLLQGGYATVYATITNVMNCLAEFPEVYNLLLKEQQEIASSMGSKNRLSWEDVRKMKYSWDVTCEVMRIFPPAFGGFKEAIADLNYGGYTIPKGWKMHWSMYATHRNPEYFPDPERFDPSRFQGDGPASYTFVPFGGGTRMCPGNDYARLAILIFVHNVATNFRWEKAIPDEQVIQDPTLRPAHGLPVYLHHLKEYKTPM